MSIMAILLIVTLLESETATALPDWFDIEGQIEIEVTREQNFDLLPPQNETLHVLRPELQLETSIEPWPGIEGVLVLELAHAFDLQDDTDHDQPDLVCLQALILGLTLQREPHFTR